MDGNTKIRLITTIIVSTLVLMVNGCSSAPKPVVELANAETALSQAEYNGARNYAPVDIERASNKLEKAYIEFKQDNYPQAELLANEALVDANLASAKTATEKAIDATKLLEESVLLLEESLKKSKPTE